MTTSLDSAETLMRLQAMANSQMRELNIELSARSEIKSVIKECQVDHYQQSNKTSFSVCVDVETTRDIPLSFCFEVVCENKRWYVEALIAQTFREGQHTLEDYPDSFPVNLKELEAAATKAISWLVSRAKLFDFDDLN